MDFFYVKTDGLAITQRLLQLKPHQFLGSTALYHPWVPTFNCNTLLSILVSTWITLNALPLEFTSYAQLVASLVGLIISSEDNIANSCSPKFCVGLQLDQDWIDSVGIIGHTGTLSKVRVDYVLYTLCCHLCHDPSHSREACPNTISRDTPPGRPTV